MLGLGLSLLGGAVMEDADGARAYFPAAAVQYTDRGDGSRLSFLAYENKEKPIQDWDISAMSGSFRCRVLKRGERLFLISFGQYSRYATNYRYYTAFILSLSGRAFDITDGNCTALLYTAADTTFRPGSYPTSFKLLFSDPSTGDLSLCFNGNALSTDVFGRHGEETLPELRVDNVYSANVTVAMFNCGYIDAVFYGSCWRNPHGAWQCLPMHSANGGAALFETTTQQLVEHESLSTAA